jgi:hypothetical protein
MQMTYPGVYVEEVGFAPLKPAEFIILKIQLRSGNI